MASTSSGVNPLVEELPPLAVVGWECCDSASATFDVTSWMVRQALGIISSVPFFLCVAATKSTREI